MGRPGCVLELSSWDSPPPPDRFRGERGGTGDEVLRCPPAPELMVGEERI